MHCQAHVQERKIRNQINIFVGSQLQGMRVWKAQPQHMQLTFLRYVNVNIALALTFFYGTRRQRQRQRCHGAANKQRSIRKEKWEGDGEREMETKWNARNFAAAASAAFQLFDSNSSSSSKNHSNNTNNEARPENNGSCGCNERRECQPRQVVYLGYLRRTNWVSSVRQSCPQFCLSPSLTSPLHRPLLMLWL